MKSRRKRFLEKVAYVYMAHTRNACRILLEKLQLGIDTDGRIILK
jgi:hypothetical protein